MWKIYSLSKKKISLLPLLSLKKNILASSWFNLTFPLTKLTIQCHRHTDIQTEHVALFLAMELNRNLYSKVNFKICTINSVTKSFPNNFLHRFSSSHYAHRLPWILRSANKRAEWVDHWGLGNVECKVFLTLLKIRRERIDGHWRFPTAQKTKPLYYSKETVALCPSHTWFHGYLYWKLHYFWDHYFSNFIIYSI